MDSIHTCNIKNEENTMVLKSYIQHDLDLFPGWLNTRVVFRVRAVVTDPRVLKKLLKNRILIIACNYFFVQSP